MKPVLFTWGNCRVAVMATLLLAAVDARAAVFPPPEVLGHWEGHARIIVTWCARKDLAISVTIHPDGRVEGTVGDAVLRNGRIVKNMRWSRHLLRLARIHVLEYQIVADLEGPVVRAEDIARRGVKMPLDCEGGALRGGLGTTGWTFGGKETMILSACCVVLERDEQTGNP